MMRELFYRQFDKGTLSQARHHRHHNCCKICGMSHEGVARHGWRCRTCCEDGTTVDGQGSIDAYSAITLFGRTNGITWGLEDIMRNDDE